MASSAGCCEARAVTAVRFIGSGDAFGSGGRLQTCILVEDAPWRALLDCGTTSLVGLKRAGIDPASIDLVVISHLHGDHFGGLPFLLLDAQFNSRRSTPLVLAGHADLEPRLRSAMDVLFPGSQRALEKVDVRFETLEPGPPRDIGPAAVQVFEVDHACGSPPFAVRLTTPSGATVAYSGDTAWTETLVEAADGVDLFVVETYVHDRVVPWHLDHATVAANLDRLRARRVIGTHAGAELRARDPETLAVPLADDGLVVEL